MQVEERLHRLLNDFNSFGVKINGQTRLIEDIGFDSLTIIEFLLLLECEFNIVIDDSEVTKSNFAKVKDVLRFIKRKIV